MRNKVALSFFVCVIVFAPQALSANVDTTAAYMTVFGRPATQVEIDYWQNRLPASQAELIEINLNWLVSPAGAKDLKETVVRGFQQVSQRSPTAAEQQEWENKIRSEKLTYVQVTAMLKGSTSATPETKAISGAMEEMEQALQVTKQAQNILKSGQEVKQNAEGTVQQATNLTPVANPSNVVLPEGLSIKTSCKNNNGILSICAAGNVNCATVSYSCFPYKCDSSSNTCNSSCMTASECAPGADCNAQIGQCVLSGGNKRVSIHDCLGRCVCPSFLWVCPKKKQYTGGSNRTPAYGG